MAGQVDLRHDGDAADAGIGDQFLQLCLGVEAADAAGIQSIPAFHVYLNGARQEVVVGAAETKLRDAIKKAQAKL